MLGFLFPDIALAVLSILFGGQVGQRVRLIGGLGLFVDALERRDAPAATRARPEAFGHPARMTNLFPPSEMPEFPQRYVVAVTDMFVPIHVAIIGPQG